MPSMSSYVSSNGHVVWNVVPIIIAIPVLLYVAYQRLFSPLAGVPGPFLASLTRAWYAYTVHKGGMHERLPALHRQYGSLVRIAPNELSVSDPEAVKRIYAAGSGFYKSKWYSVWQGHRKFDLFGEQDETIHGNQRRLVSSAYSLKSIQELEKYVDSALGHFLQRMEDIRPQTIDMGQWIQYFAFDVIGEVTFSKRFGFMDAGDQDGSFTTIQNAIRSASWLGQVPWLYWIDDYLSPLLGHRAACQARHGTIRTFAVKEVAARQDRGSDHDDILGKLFAVHAERPQDFDETAVASMATSNVFAGSDTTAASARALVYFLVKHSECKARLVQELTEAKNAGKLSTLVRREEAEQLPYFMACLWEAFRCHPQPGMTMPRVVPQGGLDIRGRFIPKETIVGCSPWVLHKNKDIFGSDADQFNPDRWLKGDAAEMRRYILTFGQGSRICLGRNLAETEIKKLVPTLFQHYDVNMADPTKDWVVQARWFAIQSGFNVRLTPRGLKS